MTFKYLLGAFLLMGCASWSAASEPESAAPHSRDLNVMVLNVWMEAKNVPNGFAAVVDEIVRVNPDIVMFCEANNRTDGFYVQSLLKELQDRGLKYYGQGGGSDVQMISRYPVTAQSGNIPDGEGTSVLRTTLDVNGEKVIVYTTHLDYTHYECYMPRGYSGTTWQKMPAPVTDTEIVMAANDESKRDESIRAIIKDALTQKADLILLGGDFNEPSHLDWGEDTKTLWDHNGAVIPWTCSSLLYAAGFRDAYREKYPDPVTHPGFTFPSDNAAMPVSKLTWAPDADERDRIDFIYFIPSGEWKVDDACIVGPAGSIVRSQRVAENTQDKFSSPSGTWPTDHKGVLIKFTH